ncbi:MAG TPA: condensation domain-containing protein [Candidatus Dormibacteraeota bacterium]|nr:condensation domain-containing protein [Candidatus Dormibacteraeota bacterium]
MALSAHTRSALGRRARELADRMERPPAPDMADVAHTCNIGRTALPVRACVVAATTDALLRELRSIGEADMGQAGVARVAFVFPGQGGQVAGAGQALAARYPVFRTAVEEAVEAAAEPVRRALRQLLLDELPAADQARLLARSEVAQPWLVALGRALTFLCMDWGIRPAAVAGHSTGEYTAACVAGGLSLRDCMAMVAERGRLMDEEAPTGAMLSVLLPAGEIGPWLADGLLVAGRNSRDHTLVAGSVEAVASLADRLAASGVPVRRLNNHNANHSALLDPIVAPFRTAVGGAAPMELRIPMVSTLTGSWLEDGPDIDHWCAHLTSPVDLAAALDRLADRGITHLVELGPSGGLPSLAGYHYAARPGPVALASMASRDGPDEVTALQRVVGRLWRDGAAVEWRRVNGEDGGRTVSLPAYPFERRRHWMPPPSPAGGPISQADAPVRRAPSEWLYEERWERLPLPPAHEVGDVDGTWLVVSGGGRLSRSIAAALRRDGCRVVWAEHAACFVAHRDRHALDWTDAAQRHRLAGALAAKGVRPDRMLLVSAAADGLEARADAGPAWEAAAVTAALAARRPVSGGPVRALLVTRGAVSASSGEAAEPMEAALRALRVVAPQEDPDLDLRQVDLAPGGRGETRLVLAELSPRADEPEVAIRGRRRLAPSWRRVPEAPEPAPLRRGGRYLVTGGLGAVGTELAAHLLMELEATVLVLGSRPVAELADGPGAARLRRLTGLAARSGGTVRYVAADVADQGSLAAAMAPLLREGPLHGVFHLAARIEGRAFQRLLAECDRQVLEKQLAPKLLGLRSLDAVLDGHATDFRLAFSSISTVLGGLGYLPYSISNLALVAEAIRRPGWTVADWDIWETPDDEPERDLRASALRGTGMEPADALGRLRQVLAGSRRRTLVSTVDLSERLAHVRARLAGAVDREDRPAAAPVQVDDPAPVDGSLEDVVAAVWSRVLHSEARPRPESHFAELGGDSLSAIKVALELSARLDVRVGAADMLQATSFADFCARVRARTAADNGRPAIQPQRSSAVDAGRPVSPLEERWLHMEPRGFGYLDVPVLIEGRLDPGAMRTAVATVWGRHETLHGRYELAPDGQPRYVAEPGWRPDLEVVDLRHIGPAALPHALHSCLADLQRRRFDLYAEVPWAVRLVLLDEARSLLFGRTHHAVFDGWSATLVAEELDVAYRAIAGGQEPSLPSAPQYGEFAAGQRRYLEGAEILEDRRYWRDVFAGCDGPTCLPGDRTDVGSTAARRVTRRVASLAAGRLRRAAAAAGVTLFGVLSAAFARLLADATGEPDIVFGTTAAGRYEPGTERTVGVFVNPLPVRVPVRGGQAHLLRAAHDALIGFHEHQRYLLADLVAHVPPFAGRDINDTFSAYLLLQNYPRPRDQGLLRYRLLETDTVLEDPVLAAVQKDGASLMREFELVVYEESDGALTLNFWYRTATFGREAAGGLADRYVRLVSELAGAAAAD